MSRILDSEVKEWKEVTQIFACCRGDVSTDGKFIDKPNNGSTEHVFTFDAETGYVTEESYNKYFDKLKEESLNLGNNKYFNKCNIYDLNTYTYQQVIFKNSGVYDDWEGKLLNNGKFIVKFYMAIFIVDLKKELTYNIKYQRFWPKHVAALYDIDEDCKWGAWEVTPNGFGGTTKYEIKSLYTDEYLQQDLKPIGVVQSGTQNRYFLIAGKIYHRITIANDKYKIICYDYSMNKIWECDINNPSRFYDELLSKHIRGSKFIFVCIKGIYKVDIETGNTTLVVPTLSKRMRHEDTDKYSEMFSTFTHAFECISEMQKSIMDIEERFRK